MNKLILILPLFGILVSGFIFPSAFSQDFGGGVDKDGDWYVGEGLKHGDLFSYRLCHVDFKECADFRMDFWIEGDIRVGTEDKWLVQTVVYDGNKILKGTMELGKVAPEPSGGSKEIASYRSAFKSSIAWLSAFATSYGGEGGEGPKKFKMPSWGKIGNIGGEQVKPYELVPTMRVSAGTFEDVVEVGWKTGGKRSHIWVLDEFPFPIKADTFTQVSEGIPPQEYSFELLDYQENIQQDPFASIIPTTQKQIAAGCATEYEFESIKGTTEGFKYLVDAKYGPPNPQTGCEMEWILNFKSKFDETEFLNQVQYDIWIVDDKGNKLRTISSEEGRPFLYSPSGQVRTSIPVDEPPGTAHYVIFIYGLSHENIAPSPESWDAIRFDIQISGNGIITPPVIPPTQPKTELDIPEWIKNNAGWWADGQIGDSDFVSGIQWLIENDVLRIPQTQQGIGSGTGEIPNWIKNNAGWWADGQIGDSDFVSGIQWLIENGILRIS